MSLSTRGRLSYISSTDSKDTLETDRKFEGYLWNLLGLLSPLFKPVDSDQQASWFQSRRHPRQMDLSAVPPPATINMGEKAKKNEIENIFVSDW